MHSIYGFLLYVPKHIKTMRHFNQRFVNAEILLILNECLVALIYFARLTYKHINIYAYIYIYIYIYILRTKVAKLIQLKPG